jgi:hypothetical protein
MVTKTYMHSALRHAACLLCALLLVACARDRWTLWEIAGNDARKVEAGLERQTCELLRDRAEQKARGSDALLYDLKRQLVAAGGRLDPSEHQPPHTTYRCRRDGE